MGCSPHLWTCTTLIVGVPHHGWGPTFNPGSRVLWFRPIGGALQAARHTVPFVHAKRIFLTRQAFGASFNYFHNLFSKA